MIMENKDKDRNREKIIADLFSLLEYIDGQIQSRQSIPNSECEKHFKFSISQVKEILENPSIFEMQYTANVKANDYASRFISGQNKNNKEKLEENFASKSEFALQVQQNNAQVQQFEKQTQELTVQVQQSNAQIQQLKEPIQELTVQVQQSNAQIQQLKEKIQELTVQIQQNNVQNFQLLRHVQQNTGSIEKKDKNQSEVGVTIPTKLENETKATGMLQKNTIENIILSQAMQEQMENIVQEDSTCNYFDSLKFILKDADEWAQHPRPFQNIDEAKKVPLKCKVGNAQFNGIQAKEEPYCFLVPSKGMIWNKKNLMEKGYEEFFQIDSSDDLKGTYTTILLKKPAIIEKRQDGLYYLVERGHIQVKQ